MKITLAYNERRSSIAVGNKVVGNEKYRVYLPLMRLLEASNDDFE
jgi:hypothetical protein